MVLYKLNYPTAYKLDSNLPHLDQLQQEMQLTCKCINNNIPVIYCHTYNSNTQKEDILHTEDWDFEILHFADKTSALSHK